MRQTARAGLLALTLLAVVARAGAEPKALPEPVDPSPEPNWVVPSVHALGVMTGMRIGAAIIWPEPFADPDLGRIGDSYEYALHPRAALGC